MIKKISNYNKPYDATIRSAFEDQDYKFFGYSRFYVSEEKSRNLFKMDLFKLFNESTSISYIANEGEVISDLVHYWNNTVRKVKKSVRRMSSYKISLESCFNDANYREYDVEELIKLHILLDYMKTPI